MNSGGKLKILGSKPKQIIGGDISEQILKIEFSDDASNISYEAAFIFT